jgi:hypothetical protein
VKRTYARVVHRSWGAERSVEEALAANDVITTYYLDDDTIGRIDFVRPASGIHTISYREVPPPFDELVAEHFAAYPNAKCEVLTPANVTPAGDRIVWSKFYVPPGRLKYQYEFHLDEAGRTTRAIEIKLDGTRGEEERPIYDAQGKRIGRTIHTPDGREIDRYLDADEAERDLV